MLKAVAAVLLLATPAFADTLVVGNKAEDSVSLIDLETGRERRRLETGSQPHEVAISPDGARAAVVAYGGTTIDIFDIASAKRTARIDLTPNRRPHGIAWLEDGRIIATTEGSDTVTVVDASAGRVLASIPTGQEGSHMLAVGPDARRAYVSNLGARTVSVLDLEKRAKITDLKAGEEPEGIALTPDGRQLWVANRASDNITVFDTATLKPIATIPVGDVPIRLAISPDGRTAVTSNLRDGSLTLIDVPTRKLTRTVPVSGSPEPQQVTILFHPSGERLFVAETGAARVAEVDLSNGRVLRRLPVGKGGDGLGISPIDVAAR